MAFKFAGQEFLEVTKRGEKKARLPGRRYIGNMHIMGKHPPPCVGADVLIGPL